MINADKEDPLIVSASD